MKTRTHKTQGIARIAGACLTMAAAVASAAPRIQTGPEAEVTYDGLHRIDGSVMAMAWAKPDLDLSRYTKIMLLPAGMTFKEVDDPGLRRSATDFPLTEEQKQTLRETILQAFVEHQGDAWTFTVEYLARALAATPEAEASHAFYAAQMERLGGRLAQLHRALARRSGDPAFDPEPFTVSDREAWTAELTAMLETALDDLPAAADWMDDGAKQDIEAARS